MSDLTQQHKRTLALRDDLADVLQEEVESVAELVFDGADDQFYRDLAESLIGRGWVLDYPYAGEELSE